MEAIPDGRVKSEIIFIGAVVLVMERGFVQPGTYPAFCERSGHDLVAKVAVYIE